MANYDVLFMKLFTLALIRERVEELASAATHIWQLSDTNKWIKWYNKRNTDGDNVAFGVAFEIISPLKLIKYWPWILATLRFFFRILIS